MERVFIAIAIYTAVDNCVGKKPDSHAGKNNVSMNLFLLHSIARYFWTGADT